MKEETGSPVEETKEDLKMEDDTPEQEEETCEEDEIPKNATEDFEKIMGGIASMANMLLSDKKPALVVVDFADKSFLATDNDGDLSGFMRISQPIGRELFAAYAVNECLGTLTTIHFNGAAGFMVTTLSPEQDEMWEQVKAVMVRAHKMAEAYATVGTFKKMLGEK